MHSNQSGAVQWRGNHSIFNEKPVKESVMGITKNVRTNALRTVWILFTFTPMVMLYNAARADEPVVTQRVSFKDALKTITDHCREEFERLLSRLVP